MWFQKNKTSFASGRHWLSWHRTDTNIKMKNYVTFHVSSVTCLQCQQLQPQTFGWFALTKIKFPKKFFKSKKNKPYLQEEKKVFLSFAILAMHSFTRSVWVKGVWYQLMAQTDRPNRTQIEQLVDWRDIRDNSEKVSLFPFISNIFDVFLYLL